MSLTRSGVMPDPKARRRDVLRASAATGLILSGAGLAQLTGGSGGTSVRTLGAVPAPGRDNTRAIQRTIDEAARRGGGVVLIDGTYECGVLTISGDNVTLRGTNGRLVNARIVIPEGRRGTRIENLGIIDRRDELEPVHRHFGRRVRDRDLPDARKGRAGRRVGRRRYLR